MKKNKEKSTVNIILDFLTTLKENGIDLNSILEDDIYKSNISLIDIKQDNVDIPYIINRLELPPYYKIKAEMIKLIKAYNRTYKYSCTEEDRKRIESLGINLEKYSEVSTLIDKETEQQELQRKLEEVKKLRNAAQTAVEETQDI